jgi:peptidoglycan/LPS O-acetylase OafA/YrhL
MTEAKAGQGARDVSLDAARGALMAYIIAVVHGAFWLGVIPPRLGGWLLFEMPPVFIITGAAFQLGERAKASPTPYLKFLWRRTVRIMLPYAVYALACAAISLAAYYRRDGLSLHAIAAALWAWLNPLTIGAGHTMFMLSWHLWFVAPFLLATAALPFIAPRAAPVWLRPWRLALIGFVVVLGLNQTAFPQHDLVQEAVFYGMWAVFGVLIAAQPGRYRSGEYVLVMVLAIAAIVAARLAFPAAVSLEMQVNKFPPNGIFFLFSCAWMAAWLLAFRALGAARTQKLAQWPALKPFINAGYSIYMWQGIGYSAAAFIGRPLGWSVLLIWVLALAITVILGLLLAPVERIRVR